MKKQYLANISNEAITNNPIINNSNENDFDYLGDIVWTRLTTGAYEGFLENAFPVTTHLFIQQDIQGINQIGIQRISDDKIAICTYEENNQVDGILNNTSFWVIVPCENTNYTDEDLSTILYAQSVLVKKGLIEEANRIGLSVPRPLP